MENSKNYFFIAATIALIAVAYGVVSYVGTYGKSARPNGFPTFTVSAEGRAVMIPDVASFSFGVTTEGGKEVGALQKENTEKVNKAIAAVKALGVEAKDIKTASYSISPRYQYFSCPQPLYYPYNGGTPRPCPPSEIVGYTISQTVTVKLRDFEKIGRFIADVTASGVNAIFGPNFALDDPYAAQNQARAEAIGKARAKAQAIATAAGFRVGRLISINEGGIYPYDRYALLGKGGDFAVPEAAPAPAIEPGSEEVTAQVTLTFEME